MILMSALLNLRPIYLYLIWTLYTWSASLTKGLFRCASGFLETYRVQETKCDGTIDLYNGTDMLEENKDRMYSMTHPNGSTYETCINWNQYYTECRAGPENPFKGAISFDNIGYAWIAIFQDRFKITFFSDELSKRCRRGGAREREWNNSKTLKRWYHLKGGLILCTMWWMLILSFHSYTLFSWLSLVHSSWSICAWLLSQHNLAKQSNENSDWWKKRDWNSCQMIQHSLLIRIVFKMFTI